MDAVDESLLSELRAALMPGADRAARRAGADVCRTLLTVLEPSATTAPPMSPTERTGQTISTPVAPAPTAFVQAPARAGPRPSQVLDMVIAHLRSKLPADHARPTSAGGFRVAIIPMRRPGGS